MRRATLLAWAVYTNTCAPACECTARQVLTGVVVYVDAFLDDRSPMRDEYGRVLRNLGADVRARLPAKMTTLTHLVWKHGNEGGSFCAMYCCIMYLGRVKVKPRTSKCCCAGLAPRTYRAKAYPVTTTVFAFSCHPFAAADALARRKRRWKPLPPPVEFLPRVVQGVPVCTNIADVHCCLRALAVFERSLLPLHLPVRWSASNSRFM